MSVRLIEAGWDPVGLSIHPFLIFLYSLFSSPFFSFHFFVFYFLFHLSPSLGNINSSANHSPSVHSVHPTTTDIAVFPFCE